MSAKKVKPREVRLVGVPMDLGAGRRGVDMGPSAARYAGLAAKVRSLGYDFVDRGDMAVPIPERRTPGQGPRYLREIVRVCERLAPRVERILDDKALPLVIGGDHSMAIGSVAGVASHFRKQGKKFGLIWIDAHADMNTDETSPSGNIHGMPLAALLGYGHPQLVNIGGFAPKVAPENTVLIGLRDVDDRERELVMRSGLTYFEMMKVDVLGAGAVIQEALEIASRGTDGIHLSLDVDGIDPDYAPGVGTPVPGGITMREAHMICELIADSGMLVSLELAELNPILDNRNGTAVLMCDLIASALGKKVMGPFVPPGSSVS